MCVCVCVCMKTLISHLLFSIRIIWRTSLQNLWLSFLRKLSSHFASIYIYPKQFLKKHLRGSLNEISLSCALKKQSLSNKKFLWVLLKDFLCVYVSHSCKCSSVIGLCFLLPKYGERLAFSSRTSSARPVM